MCVIINIEKGQFPKYETLKSAELLNSHGGSIAWLENGKINFEKGIKAKKINDLIEKRLKPNKVKTAIIHFRIASVGKINKELCHPFQISEKVNPDLKVMDSEYDLLFHNGTVTTWESMLIESLQKFKGQIPSGELSDSRVIAFLLNRHGTDIIKDSVHNKFSILTKKGIVKFGQWVKVDKNECSNDYFVKSPYEYNYTGLSIIESKPNVNKKSNHRNSKLAYPELTKQTKLRQNYKVRNYHSKDIKSKIKKFLKNQADKENYRIIKNDFYATDYEIIDHLNNGLSFLEIYEVFESAYGNKRQWINGDFVPTWENDMLNFEGRDY